MLYPSISKLMCANFSTDSNGEKTRLTHKTIRLSDFESKKMFDAVIRLPDPYQSKSKLEKHLSLSYLTAMQSMPTDPDLPETPMADQGDISNKSTFVSEGLLTGLSQALGDVVCYEDERGGTYLHNVAPAKEEVGKLSSGGSKRKLKLHTELSFFQSRPDFLSLICVKKDHDSVAETTFVDVEQAVQLLSKSTIQLLQSKRFIHRTPDSFHKAHNGEIWSSPTPVLFSRNGQYFANLSFVFSKALDSEAETALALFEEALDAREQSVKLTPGDFLVIDNHKALHSRRPFIPKFDGQDRWLQRVFILSALKNNPDVSENYFRNIITKGILDTGKAGV